MANWRDTYPDDYDAHASPRDQIDAIIYDLSTENAKLKLTLNRAAYLVRALTDAYADMLHLEGRQIRKNLLLSEARDWLMGNP